MYLIVNIKNTQYLINKSDARLMEFYVNNFSYADDIVLLGPTVGSIRTLLKIYEEYAIKHGLTYNVKKSEHMVFVVRGRVINYEPVFKLNRVPLRRVKLFKYLGHYISEDLKNLADIERDRRVLGNARHSIHNMCDLGPVAVKNHWTH